MNKQLKELAEQAGVSFHHALGATYTYGKLSEILERFAKLVRQDERELCAKLCDLFAKSSANVPSRYEFMGESAQECANLVRARGNHEQD